MFNSKVILITGGTGSFGKNCAYYILKKFKPRKVIIFSRDELKQYEMSNELKDQGIKDENVTFFIGDVRDEERLNLAFKDVDFVIHAAALKHVDIYHPIISHHSSASINRVAVRPLTMRWVCRRS